MWLGKCVTFQKSTLACIWMWTLAYVDNYLTPHSNIPPASFSLYKGESKTRIGCSGGGVRSVAAVWQVYSAKGFSLGDQVKREPWSARESMHPAGSDPPSGTVGALSAGSGPLEWDRETRSSSVPAGQARWTQRLVLGLYIKPAACINGGWKNFENLLLCFLFSPPPPYSFWDPKLNIFNS